MIFAQLPQPIETVTAASNHSWEAALLASLVVSGFGFLGWMLKKVMADSQSREVRMATRIDLLQEAEKETHREYSTNLMNLNKAVTTAILTAAQAQDSQNATLARVEEVMRGVNGDLRELCALMKQSPCLLVGANRGDYKLIDATGNEVTHSEVVRVKGHDIEDAHPDTEADGSPARQ
jgi:hypothetical protein